MSIINSQPLIGASGQGGYFLTKSLRFRSSASAYLSKTWGANGSSQTFTISAWVKRGALGSTQAIVTARQNGLNNVGFRFTSADVLELYAFSGGSLVTNLITTQVFRDPSAWYHIVCSVNTTQATSTNRVKFYVNGTQITAFSTATYPSLNATTLWNQTAATHYFATYDTSSELFDGYMAEINVIDGQALTPSSFGQTDSATGVWQPAKYTGTYGTNGFYLPFTNTTSTSTLGNDFSGNSNTWTVNNISLTSGATYDSMTDVPTNTNLNTANYAVLSPLTGSSVTPTPINGNLTISTTTIGQFYGQVYGFRSSQTKFYFEVQQQQGATGTAYFVGARLGDLGAIPFYAADGSVGGVSGSAGATYTNGDVIGVALDPINATIEFFKNGISQGGSRTITGGAGEYYPFISVSDSGTRVLCHCNFGQQPFAYTPPSGFKALNTFNLPTPTIGATASTQANDYFNVVTYSGTSATQTVSGVNFQPDFVWIKNRSNGLGFNHVLQDAVRGFTTGKKLASNLTTSEGGTNLTDDFGYVSSANSDGFVLSKSGTGSYDWYQTNATGDIYVSWNWKANGSGSTNTAGSITSTVSANTTAGFSIVTYTGTGANATVGHGLGVAPKMIIVKNRGDLSDWAVWHTGLSGNSYYIYLNKTSAQSNVNAMWNNTAPTSTVFSLGTSTDSNDTKAMVAYCFAEVAGYSAFGSYTGNGSADGTFVYTGFRPRFVLFKRTDTTANWYVYDTARKTFNTMNEWLAPNLSDAENSATTWEIDILSNGFKMRNSGAFSNANGGTYIYAAFAENPFKYSLAR